jgi:phosphate acyltransferase
MSNFIIAFDVMGGDFAPQSSSQALIAVALRKPHIQFQAIGLPHILSQHFATKPSNIITVPVQHTVDMSMTVAEASNLGIASSMGKMIDMIRNKEANVGVSAGNTTALMSLAYLMLKMQEGVRRPAIMSSCSYRGNRTYITDLGANIASKPEDMFMNAVMAVREVKKENPSIALLNVGSEANKGTPVIKAAAKLFEESSLNYIGFVEGSDILTARADIVICDGFVGNCLTKLLESMTQDLSQHISDNAYLPKFQHAAFFTGLNGLIYKAHGSCQSAQLEQVLEDVLSHQETLIVA